MSKEGICHGIQGKIRIVFMLVFVLSVFFFQFSRDRFFCPAVADGRAASGDHNGQVSSAWLGRSRKGRRRKPLRAGFIEGPDPAI